MPLPRFAPSWLGVVLLLTAVSPQAVAQTLLGTVTDQAGATLSGVQVYFPVLSQGGITDAEGRYQISGIPEGTHAVEFRFIGFRTHKASVTLIAGQSLELNVQLVQESIRVDEVVVTAESQADAMLKRSTRSVSILGPESLDRLRGQTLGDMLDELPGVTSLNTGPSISKPVIRGLHSQRLVVLNAGVAQEGQQWGGEHAPEIDPFAPTQVEVIKGAAGVEYGVGAIGGVIRLDEADLPTLESVSGRVMLNGFSNNRQGAGSIIVEGGPLRFPGLGWRVQSSYRRAGDSRTPNHVIRNSGFREADASASLGWEGDAWGWHVHASHFGTTLGLFKGAHIGNYGDLLRAIDRGAPAVDYEFSFDIDAPRQTIAHDLATLRSHVRLGTGDWLEAQYGFQSNRRQEFDAHGRFGSSIEDPAFSLALETHTLDLKLRQRPRGSWLGVLGVSGMRQSNVNGEAAQLIPNFRAWTGGIFARQTHVSGPLTLEFGVRADYRWLLAYPREQLATGDFVRRTHDWSSVTAVSGAIWRFSEHWSLSANVASAWRPPGVNELYNYGVHHGTAQFEVGNPDLKAERSLGTDATLRHLSDSYTVELSVYVNQMNGYIHLVPDAEPRVTIRGTFPSFFYGQTDARLAGLDGSGSVRVTSHTRLSGVFSLVRATDRKASEPLIFMPADRLKLIVERDLSSRLTADAHVNLVARQNRYPEALDYADPPDGYALVGMALEARANTVHREMSIILGVDNLLNTSYRDYLSRFRYFIEDPGRTISLRVSIPLNRTENAYP